MYCTVVLISVWGTVLQSTLRYYRSTGSYYGYAFERYRTAMGASRCAHAALWASRTTQRTMSRRFHPGAHGCNQP